MMNSLFSKKESFGSIKESVELNNEGIDRLSKLLVDALEAVQIDSKDATRLRLSVEEILLIWKANVSSPSVCSFSCGERFGRPYIYISLPGARMDLAELDLENEDSILYSALLAQSGIFPAYDYINGENRLSISPSRIKISSKKSLLPTICVAAVLGVLCRYLPLGLSSFINEFVSLLLSTFTGILSAIAGPLVFLSIIVGIINIGDISSFKRIGKSIILRLLLFYLLILLIATFISIWFFLGEGVASVSNSGAIIQIIKTILNIIPNNLFAPFVSGNTLQIIFIAMCFGITILLLGSKVSQVQSFIIQSDKLITTIMEFLGKNMEVLIFISVLSIALSVSLDGIGALLMGLGIAICLNIMSPLVYTLIASIKLKVSFVTLFEKLVPAYLLALTTASSSASLSTVLETCEKKLGIHRRMFSFSVPLTQIMLRPGTATGHMLMILAFSSIYGISITPTWLLIMLLADYLLSFATPPIPGGGIAIITILLAQAGIPETALTVAIAYYLIADHFNTACNVACLQAEVLLSADKLDMIDRDILRS